MNTKSGASPKTIDILLANFTEALKSVDLSILLAFTAVAFVVLHGLEGSFSRDIAERVNRVAQERSVGTKSNSEKAESRSRETDVPLLGFKAELVSAASAAMIGYWVLCLRAAFRVRRARAIARRLAELDREIINAALLYPSLATSGRAARILSCAALGAFGYASYLSLYLPISQQLGKDMTETMTVPIFMLLPAAYVGWQLWIPLVTSDGRRDAA
jgi:hypothetical protein